MIKENIKIDLSRLETRGSWMVSKKILYKTVSLKVKVKRGISRIPYLKLKTKSLNNKFIVLSVSVCYNHFSGD